MPDVLPPFSGHGSTATACIKCGGGDQPPATTWVPAIYQLMTDGSEQMADNWETVDPQPGWMGRQCRVCGFLWPEATLDA
jgi:hypothetical protein